MNDPRLDHLIHAHLDDALEGAACAEFEAMLLESASARRRFWELAEVHGLAREAARLVWVETAPPAPAPTPALAKWRRLAWRPLAAAAAVMLLFAGWWLSRAPALLEVVSVSGVVQFTRADGGMSAVFAAGEKLSAGRFEAVDDDALLRLRFADGTLLEFSGPMDARISETDAKRVRIVRGVLTAEVARQPAGRPLRVSSPTTELEVLGTVFTLDAAAEDARLSVAEGKVRLRRVADGGVAEVAARQSVVATAKAAEALQPAIPPAPPREWAATFDSALETFLCGRVLAAEARSPLRMRAVGRLKTEVLPGEHAIHPRVVLAPLRLKNAALVALAEEAEFELRWRTATPSPIDCLIYTRLPTGRWGGLFGLRLPAKAATDAEGWHVVRVPLTAFRPGKSQEAQTVANLEATRFVMTTLRTDLDVGLEVAALRVIRPPMP